MTDRISTIRNAARKANAARSRLNVAGIRTDGLEASEILDLLDAAEAGTLPAPRAPACVVEDMGDDFGDMAHGLDLAGWLDSAGL